jgi:hypothetical protein
MADGSIGCPVLVIAASGDPSRAGGAAGDRGRGLGDGPDGAHRAAVGATAL